MANVVVYFHGGKSSDNWIQCKLHKNNRFVNWVTGRSIEPDHVWVPRGPARGGGGHVACLNFKTSCVSVYKCLSLIVIFAVTVPIWLREVVSCRDFILHAVATFWAMSLVGIYPGRASTYGHCLRHVFSIYRWVFNEIVPCWSSHNDDNGCKKIKKVSGLWAKQKLKIFMVDFFPVIELLT